MEPYTATKFAVVAMSEGWAQQLAPLGIGMSVLCPGFVKTRIHESNRARQSRYGERAPDTRSDEARSEAAKMVQGGMDPDIVGERVLEAIKAGEFYIFTHPEMKAAVDARFAGIDAGFKHAEESHALKAGRK
jgi:NAD(P)-dependent dehydrogenase (short-subunit alcohol dehydrogenase family)